MDGLQALVWTATPDRRIDFANRRWVEYTGLDPAEEGGSDWQFAICREDLPQSQERWREIFTSGEPGELEARLRRFEARDRWFLIRCGPLCDDAERIVKWCCVGMDVEVLRRPDEEQASILFREATHPGKHRCGEEKVDQPVALRTQELATANEVLEKEIEELRQTNAALCIRRALIFRSVISPRFGSSANGEITYTNQKALEYIGLMGAWPKDWSTDIMVHHEDRPRAIEFFTQAIALCEPFELELRLRRFDGVYRWFGALGFPLQYASGGLLRWYNLLIDMNDRKRAEEALYRSESALRREHEHLVTAQRLSHTGSFTSAVLTDEHIRSDELYRISEQDPGTVVSFRSFRTSIHPEDLASFNAAFANSIADGEDFDQVFRIVTRSGNLKHLHSAANRTEDTPGQPVFMRAIQDVTESKVVAEALAGSERNLRLVVNTMPRLAATTRTGGSWDFINQNYLDYLELTLEWSTNLQLSFGVHPDDMDALVRTGRNTGSSGGVATVEARLRRFDGVYRWCLYRTVPLRNEFGAIVIWFSVIIDIENRKRAEVELRRTQAKLAKMVHVPTMGQLTASIAHEVNQPLSGIITNANTCLHMLAANPPNIEGARETTRRTIRDGNRASEVVKRLRALISQKNAPLEPVDLNEATREVIALSRGRSQKPSQLYEPSLLRSCPS